MDMKRIPWAAILVLGLLAFCAPALAAEWQVSYTASLGARHETAIRDQEAEQARL